MIKTSMRLINSLVLENGELKENDVSIEGGFISQGAFREVDLSGYLILPGIIDLHGDAFERHLAPRPSAAFPMRSCLIATDADAAANGITTAYLAHSWSWEGGYRSPDHAEAFLTALNEYKTITRTDLRAQIRCETHTVSSKERLLKAIQRYGVEYVVFNNHLDEASELLQTDPSKLTNWALAAGRSVEDHQRAIKDASAQSSAVPRYLCELAEAFDFMGIHYGSHDDQNAETRENYSMIGAKICEFPISFSATTAAKIIGDPVLMGAPNIVRGGSQSGNISAIDVVRNNQCDALVSDYYYPALCQAAFTLKNQEIQSLPEAWAKISSAPAEILGLTDRGIIEQGKRADLTIVNRNSEMVEATICEGQITYMTGEAANRFCNSTNSQRYAAE